MKTESDFNKLAILDGWEKHPDWKSVETSTHCVWRREGVVKISSELPQYLDSYDAIIPLICKLGMQQVIQHETVICPLLDMSPRTMAYALLENVQPLRQQQTE